MLSCQHWPGNVSFTGDFDVLLDNAQAGNTSHTKVKTETEYILKTIDQQRQKWNVSYSGTRDPLERKTKNIQKYMAFKVFFFGGSLEVVARNYKIKRTKIKG